MNPSSIDLLVPPNLPAAYSKCSLSLYNPYNLNVLFVDSQVEGRKLGVYLNDMLQMSVEQFVQIWAIQSKVAKFPEIPGHIELRQA